jgi:esterase/lipase
VGVILWIVITIIGIVLTIVLNILKIIPRAIIRIVLIIVFVISVRNSAVLINTTMMIKEYYELTQVKAEELKGDVEKYKEYLNDVEEFNEWLQSAKEKVDDSKIALMKDKIDELKEIEVH